MFISTRSFRYGIAFAILYVLLVLSVFAQTTTTPGSTAPVTTATPSTATSTTTQPDAAAVLADPTVPPAGMPGTMPLGMPGAGYGAMPGMGMQPGMMGTMPMGGGMSAMDPMGGMPPMGMGGMGMRPGGMGMDPEMNAFMMRQLQELKMRETQLNSEIAMYGGGNTMAAQSLLAQRTSLQNQIRDLEQRLGISGAGTPTMPGTMGDPMAGMNPGMTPADRMMMQGMGSPRMPGVSGFDMYGPAMTGADPNRMFLEQQRQEAVLGLQRVQETLKYVDANAPVRATILAQQEELLAQIDSLNKQLGQTQTPSGTMPGPGIPGTAPGTAGSTAMSLTDLAAPAVPPARTNPVINQEIIQLQNAERQLRARGETALADSLLQQIQQRQTGSLPEMQPPPGMVTTPMNMSGTFMPQAIPPAMSAMLPQQAELAELRSTVDSMRGEIAAMRDEIRLLNAMLRRWDQTSEYPTPEQNGMFERLPDMPVYPEIPPAE